MVDMVRTPFGKAGQAVYFATFTHVDLVVPLLKGILGATRLQQKKSTRS